MFYMHHRGMHVWGWVAMSISAVLFWALLILLILVLARMLNRISRHTNPAVTPAPESLLGERYARGEIDEEEYRTRLGVLRGQSGGGGGSGGSGGSGGGGWGGPSGPAGRSPGPPEQP
ncbi:SHOCT domain-containing protein [Streptomyces sp. NPDC091292]|uniref:SHOCT domain-containing protein n=1 Tax=Streptomyces sp. NPDC091292 TaxID=3365991 RepID=UPI0038098CE0